MTTADAYVEFGSRDAHDVSPAYERLSYAVAHDDALLALRATSARRLVGLRHPTGFRAGCGGDRWRARVSPVPLGWLVAGRRLSYGSVAGWSRCQAASRAGARSSLGRRSDQAVRRSGSAERRSSRRGGSGSGRRYGSWS
ncbi:hypothetical protein JNW91_24650 [Micromonospora sp. STR1_7]|uniref:Uncharacterized protein n=1 Tax=Micromonospora parastrephiae TaxID=2806101 RepID=A0ABS1XZP4_9ACTN|nr:hypothetical protein [Micromonospora parastrephiae]